MTGKKEQISLEELVNLSFHDQCIEALKIDFSCNEVKMKIGMFNDLKNNYDFVEFIFKDVEQLSIENFNLELFSLCEIYSHEVNIKIVDRPAIRIILLLGPNRPSASLDFSFSKCYAVPLEY